MTYLWVFLGGGIGSVARYAISKLALTYYSGSFPLGTFIANILACLILVISVVFVASRNNEISWLQPLLIVGFCGGFSTFSTFSNETAQLIESGNAGVAIANIAISIVIGVALIFWIRTYA